MECNKDEALRAKEIAEKKLLEKDIQGAKKLAVKAQNLFPCLDGISQMMATLDVYLAAENKVNGEENWYGILGVNPLADEEAVRKQFRKLALMFHPDKNKTVGAEGAFKLISEAWSLLSDKSKKLAYDQRIAAVQNGVKNVGSSLARRQTGFYEFAKTTPTQTKVPKRNSDKGGSSSSHAPSHKQERQTFWTVCHQCKMQYEYLTMYRNRNLLCPNCHEAFLAIEICPPSSDRKRSGESKYSQQQQNLHSREMKRKTPNSSKRNSSTPNGVSSGFRSKYSTDNNNFQWVPFSSSPANAAAAAQAASMVQQAYDKVKREREEAQAAAKREEALLKKNRGSKRASGILPSAHFDPAKRRRASEDLGRGHYKKQTIKETAVPTHSNISGIERVGFERPKASDSIKSKDVNQIDIKQLLMDKARKHLINRLNEQTSCKSATSIDEREINGNEISNAEENREIGMADDTANEGCSSMSNSGKADDLVYRYRRPFIQQFSVEVPDSDFHDFGKERLENSFEENQVWVAFDDRDGMPRCYAMIRRVVSVVPIKMQISWLSFNTSCNQGSLSHVGCGFSRTIGEFKEGRREAIETINCFSHKVKWTKDAGGAIRIFPRRGEVWALYRNWSLEWNEFTEDEVICKYDMVEILEDYTEQKGVVVIPLIKVAGFKTLFHRHMNLREIRRIPSEEVSRFSHQVLSHVLTEKESQNTLKGCLELDPAATPSELLQVLMDTTTIEEITVDDFEEELENARTEHSMQDVLS